MYLFIAIGIFLVLNLIATLLLMKYGLTRYTKYEKNGNDD
jgi:hypothetical protein